MSSQRNLRTSFFTLLLLFAASVRAENWPGWRGPTGSGHATAERVKELPDYSSAIATADGLLYFISAGSSIVVRAGPKCEVVAVSNLGGGDGRCGPSAAVSNGRIFVRDFNFLYCIGKK